MKLIDSVVENTNSDNQSVNIETTNYLLDELVALNFLVLSTKYSTDYIETLILE